MNQIFTKTQFCKKHSIAKIIALIIGIYFFNTTLTLAQNLEVVNGVATFKGDTTIGLRFMVPDSWDTIVIKENVTVTGNFVTPDERNKDITVHGEDWNTSVLHGSGNIQPYPNNVENRRFASAISNNGKGTLFVENLKSHNPDKFHLRSEGRIIVKHCNIIEDEGRGHADGVHGGRGSKSEVHDSYISTWDDNTYLSECWLVKNTTIVMNGNGAAFQVGYGNNFVHEDPICRVENCTVIANAKKYSKGVVAWTSNGYKDGPNHAKIHFENFTLLTNPGKTPLKMYTMGGNNGKKLGSNCEIHVTSDNSICDLKENEFRSNTPGTVRVKNCGFSITRDKITSLDNEVTLSAESQIDIYPNPVKDYLTISTIRSGNLVQVFDLGGKLLLENYSTGKMDVSSLEQGIYILKIENNRLAKFIKN
ncbi:MAG: T9SS type A sorting domain-containing protein [Bacteroidales bacterium]|nr:T9SS type A sorting domain-containing protein [Bacteroidales bacterium]